MVVVEEEKREDGAQATETNLHRHISHRHILPPTLSSNLSCLLLSSCAHYNPAII